ncbi:serine/threonine-protein kinase OXI1 [Coffea arabica]|uniref:non-specific serine/threonine protein kinase n=1 Tax=Coffea arabica TaxID=13443 RepID=A0A6P6USV8_COFAR|nr:serine/threonine-protein kinase OXI1-like isoform X1 [Coffea arabica]
MSDGHNNNDLPNHPVASLDLKSLKVISALGRGAKGVVFLVRSENGESLALKTISRASIEKNHKTDAASTDRRPADEEYRRICFERDVLASLNHPLLPKLRGVLSTDKIIGYAIDYCPGRDLNSLRRKQTEKMFSDDIIRFYAAEIVLALEYLHGLGIVYRDLKPENVMIQENGHLMLVDFDLSAKLSAKSPEARRLGDSSPSSLSIKNKHRNRKKNRQRFPEFLSFCKSGITESDSVHPVEFSSESGRQESDSVEKSNSFVGTEEYVAPEILIGKGHDFAVDWWCLGVMLHEMLYGTTPFKGSNRKETFYRILAKDPELVGEPTPLRDLIKKLLEKEAKRRISVEGVKGHDLFKDVDWAHILEIQRPPFIPAAEDTQQGNKDIDVESFVQQVFNGGIDGDEKVGDKENSENKKNILDDKNKGVWVEGLNNPPAQSANFFIF